MYVATGGQMWNGGGTDFKWGGAGTTAPPPAGDGPGQPELAAAWTF